MPTILPIPSAARLGLALMHEAGIHDLDAWMSDWEAADLHYLMDIDCRGVTADPFDDFRGRYLRPHQPLLAPLAVPPFKPRIFTPRIAF